MILSIINSKNEIMYDDIALFIEIVRQNNLTAAAKQLGIPAATVTRRLQKLESTLGVQLLHRSARQCVLTAEGEHYYHAYAKVMIELGDIHKHLQANTDEMSGYLKVLAPTNISIGCLQPMWSEFILQYPDIQLELNLNNHVEDIIAQRADLALRIGPQKDSSLYQKRIGSVATYLVASPKYLQKHTLPNDINDLEQHQLLGATALSDWKLFNAQHHKTQTLRPNFFSTANDLTFITQLTIDGAGIALLPLTEIQKFIEDGLLVRILPQWQGPIRELFIIWPSGSLLSIKARALREHIENYLNKNL